MAHIIHDGETLPYQPVSLSGHKLVAVVSASMHE